MIIRNSWNKKIILMMLLLNLVTITGCSKEEKDNVNKEDIMNKISIVIDSKKYQIDLEKNETVQEFLDILPKTFIMNELNGNEKYVYLDEVLSTSPTIPNEIKKGDVMLYGNNCLVLFYQNFKTNYRYTKIGHINDLQDLGKESIEVKLEK